MNTKEQLKKTPFYKLPCILTGFYGFIYTLTYFSILSRMRYSDSGGLEEDVIFALINLLPYLFTGMDVTVATLNREETIVLFSAGLLTYFLIGIVINFLRSLKHFKKFFTPVHIITIFVIIAPFIGYNVLVRNHERRNLKIAAEKNNLLWCNFTIGGKEYCQFYVTAFNNDDIFSCEQIQSSYCAQWQLDGIVEARGQAKHTKFVLEARRDAKCIDALINSAVNPAGKEYAVSSQGKVYYDICVDKNGFTSFCSSNESGCYLQEYSCTTPTDTNAAYDKFPDGIYSINTKCELGCQNGACVVYE